MRPRPAAGGFTLVELLVVIGIIAVLVGLLFPALSRSRAQASQLQCASIMRQWGQAFHIYASENRGRLPHSGDESCNPFPFGYSRDPYYLQNECCYTDVLPPLMGRPTWSSYPLGQKPKDDIWQCPLAEVLPDAAYDFHPSQYGYHSFVMNTMLDELPPQYPYFLQLGSAKTPTVTLLMFECTLNPTQTNGQQGTSSTCYVSCYPEDGPRALGDRHPHLKGKLGGNLMMLDGHIEWTDHLYDPTLQFPNSPPVTNSTWWPY